MAPAVDRNGLPVGATDQVRLVKTISLPKGKALDPAELILEKMVKTIMFVVSGLLNITGAGGAIQARGALNYIKALTLKVGGQSGPIASDGFRQFFRNTWDRGVQPPYTDLSGAGIANNVPFEGVFLFDAALVGYGEDENRTLFWPERSLLHSLELLTGGVKAFAADPTLEIWVQELKGVEKSEGAANLYNNVVKLEKSFGGAEDQLDIPLPYGHRMNEVHVYAYTAAGVLSDSIVDNVELTDGDAVWRKGKFARMRQFIDATGPLAVPAVTPAGILRLDVCSNNRISSMPDTFGRKDLKLRLKTLAAGKVVVLYNDVRPGVRP